jgi:hypothetical protein
MDRNTPDSADSGFGAVFRVKSVATTSSNSPSRKRQRRQQNSDDSTDSTIDTKDPLRQGFPSLLPLPLWNWTLAPNAEEEVGWSSIDNLVADCFLRFQHEDFKIVLVD